MAAPSPSRLPELNGAATLMLTKGAATPGGMRGHPPRSASPAGTPSQPANCLTPEEVEGEPPRTPRGYVQYSALLPLCVCPRPSLLPGGGDQTRAVTKRDFGRLRLLPAVGPGRGQLRRAIATAGRPEEICSVAGDGAGGRAAVTPHPCRLPRCASIDGVSRHHGPPAGRIHHHTAHRQRGTAFYSPARAPKADVWLSCSPRQWRGAARGQPLAPRAPPAT